MNYLCDFFGIPAFERQITLGSQTYRYWNVTYIFFGDKYVLFLSSKLDDLNIQIVARQYEILCIRFPKMYQKIPQ